MNQLRKTGICISVVVGLFALFLVAPGRASSAASSSPAPADAVAHLPLPSNGQATMFLRQNGRSRYLYVKRSAQPGFVVVNVTNPRHPSIVKRAPLATRTVMGAGGMITQTATLPSTATPGLSSLDSGMGEGGRLAESVHSERVNMRDFPRILQTADDTTSTMRDPVRNVTYVVNDREIWVLLPR